jgi:hypothetical protein
MVSIIVVVIWVYVWFFVIAMHLRHGSRLLAFPKFGKDFFLASKGGEHLLLFLVFQVCHTCGVSESVE